MEIKLTKLQARMLLEWAITCKKADLSAYEEVGLIPYGIDKVKCRKEWNQILKQLRGAAVTRKG